MLTGYSMQQLRYEQVSSTVHARHNVVTKYGKVHIQCPVPFQPDDLYLYHGVMVKFSYPIRLA